jgi:hypothetical protein
MLEKISRTLISGSHWMRPQSEGFLAFKQRGIDEALARKQARIDARYAAVGFAEAKADFAAAASTLLMAWQKAEKCGLKVELDDYPFPFPLAEMVHQIQDWTERTSVEAR